MIKTIFYNILVFFTLANLLYWSIPTVDLIQSMLGGNTADGLGVYRSFIEWRSRPAENEFGAVGGSYLQRRTIAGHVTSDRKVYFFGGSTMWGLGSPDAATIPSKFAALTDTKPENFAEVGWTAHQNLLYLIQILQDGLRPDVVVFFDGVNDVAAKCPIVHGPYSHGKESEFASRLQDIDRPQSFAYHFRPVLRLVERIRNEASKAEKRSPYDCNSNPAKAEAIATNLLKDWELAKQIVGIYGGRFVGILQPVAYLGHARLGGLKLSADLGDQYTTIYPLIEKKIAEDPAFHDFVNVLDGDENFYLDFCHINAVGNEQVARKISELVGAKH